MANKIHPLLKTRGVPGTHDVVELLKTIELFNKKNYPIKIKKFDKLIDDRSNKIKVISSKKNIIILEGWCCGSTALDNIFLKKNINKIESLDRKYIWRNYYNNKLKNEYNYLYK